MKKLIFLVALILLLSCLGFCYAEEEADPKTVTVGDTVLFGHYEQDNNLNNGPEPIEWIVLETDDSDRALLLSRYALDALPYNNEPGDITWEDSSLRKWLIERFFYEAFNEEERDAVAYSYTDNSDLQRWSEWETTGGSNTAELVFLLSHHEVFDLYFQDDESRKCAATEYAVANGADVGGAYPVGDRFAGEWWLRSPGPSQDRAELVTRDGSKHQMYTDIKKNVRPALWVHLSRLPSELDTPDLDIRGFWKCVRFYGSDFSYNEELADGRMIMYFAFADGHYITSRVYQGEEITYPGEYLIKGNQVWFTSQPAVISFDGNMLSITYNDSGMTLIRLNR